MIRVSPNPAPARLAPGIEQPIATTTHQASRPGINSPVQQAIGIKSETEKDE